jgi:hypothetical protein
MTVLGSMSTATVKSSGRAPGSKSDVRQPKHEDMVFVWENAKTANPLFGRNNDILRSCSVIPKGRSRIGEQYTMDCRNGAVHGCAFFALRWGSWRPRLQRGEPAGGHRRALSPPTSLLAGAVVSSYSARQPNHILSRLWRCHALATVASTDTSW